MARAIDKYVNKSNFKQGISSPEDLKEGQNALVILDDLMFADPEFLAKIFSVYSHRFSLQRAHDGTEFVSQRSARDKFEFSNCYFF